MGDQGGHEAVDAAQGLVSWELASKLGWGGSSLLLLPAAVTPEVCRRVWNIFKVFISHLSANE